MRNSRRASLKARLIFEAGIDKLKIIALNPFQCAPGSRQALLFPGGPGTASRLFSRLGKGRHARPN